jgi:hypothetical protein
MSTLALMPARRRDRSWPSSKVMRTGTRCTTFTQLPAAFCAGISENCAPVPGLMEETCAFSGLAGKASTVTVTSCSGFR